MHKKIFFIALLFTVLSGCQSKSAFNYSEEIVKKEKSLLPDIEATERKVQVFAEAKQFDSLAAAGERMEGLVQKKIDEIKLMPVPDAKEADNFKTSSLRYFSYLKSLYTSYKLLGKAQTDEERQKAFEEFQKLVADKQSAINDMQKAQQKFASANGFKIK